MASVWAELKRRNVVKVAVAYAVVGWLLVQVADTFAPALQLPEWTVTLVAGLVILGFPLALILSWAYELTPEGMKRSDEVEASASITPVTGRRINFAIIGALVLALGFVVYKYGMDDGEVTVAVLPNSVAVLLCDNLSPDPDDAYFAEGIHEEILNQLVKIRALSVIARTSVLQYAETPLPIPQIAEELNVGAILECSVRHAGDSIMVTAQLIDPETNTHLWSDTYPGDLSDMSSVFAMQADIAMNIANALEAEFSLEEQEQIEKVPTENDVAYALYLRAYNTPWTADSFVEDLDRAIGLDPDFAHAYALKAYGLAYVAAPEEAADVIIDSAETALRLDESIAMAYLALGVLHENRWEGSEARRAFERAYELDPNDPNVLGEYARFKRNYTLEYDEAVRANERAAQLDPNTRSRHSQLGASYSYVGRYEAAANAFQRAISIDPADQGNHVQYAVNELRRGQHEAAIRELELAEELVSTRTWHGRFAQMAAVYGQMGRLDDARKWFRALEAREQEGEAISDAIWAIAHLAVGESNEGLQALANVIEVQVPAGIFSYGDLRIPLSNLKSNVWGFQELETPESQALRDRIFPLD